MDQHILPVESILERDIDLILLEELSTDLEFCKWFINELSLPELTSVNGVWKSITAFGLGETDILFSYNSHKRNMLVLLENKLDASFQDEQYNRYLSRAEEYIKRKDCDESFVILIAPEIYCLNQNEFENYISYECVAEKLNSNGTERNRFRSNLLKIATEKLRRGYHPVNSIPVQNFWLSYWKFKEEKYPDLVMKKPGIVPHFSDWPMLYDERLKNITFYHKLKQGNTDATFFGYPEKVKNSIMENLPDWASIKTHNKSFSIRIASGVIDRTENFETQLEPVERGLNNIKKLRDWILNNKEIID